MRAQSFSNRFTLVMDCFRASALAPIAFLLALLTAHALAGSAAAQPDAARRAPACDTLTADADAPGERQAVLVDGLGAYSRPISTDSERAQCFFDQGLRLRYGFYYPEAVSSFREALRHDPTHPMIHWGLAWAVGTADPKGVAQEAIGEALAHIDRATKRERAFIETLAVAFDTTAYPQKPARDSAFATAAGALFERYPEDPEAGVMRARALWAASEGSAWAEDGALRPWAHVAARTLETVLASHPEHPGANHLYIHLLEGSGAPEKALPHAGRVDELMPWAGHIVHMPSHVLIRLGRYEEVIRHNERSTAADEAFLDAWGDRPSPAVTSSPLSVRMHALHARSFIRLAATLQGNAERAVAEAWAVRGQAADPGPYLEQVRQERPLGNRWRADVWLVRVAFGQWNHILDAPAPDTTVPYVQGIWRYARGSAWAAQGQLDAAEEELRALSALASDSTLKRTYVKANPASTVLTLAAHALRGRIAAAEGRFDAAIGHLQKALETQEGLRYSEPPDWAFSVRYLLGDVLLAADRPQEAEAIYRAALDRHPANGWALWGLAESLKAQGQSAAAAAARTRFEQAWQHADVELPIRRF
jgi:tetratricopeptide (TPR) repeat protein